MQNISQTLCLVLDSLFVLLLQFGQAPAMPLAFGEQCLELIGFRLFSNFPERPCSLGGSIKSFGFFVCASFTILPDSRSAPG